MMQKRIEKTRQKGKEKRTERKIGGGGGRQEERVTMQEEELFIQP